MFKLVVAFAMGAVSLAMIVVLLVIRSTDAGISEEHAREAQLTENLQERIARLEAELKALARRSELEVQRGDIISHTPTPETPSSAGDPSYSAAARQAALEAAASSQALHEAIGALPAEFSGINPAALTPEGIAWRESSNLEKEGFSPERAAELAAYMAERRRELKMTESVAHGITILDREMREMLNDQDYLRYRRAQFLSTAVEISEVFEGSPAARAGLLPGDVIESYDGRPVFELGDIEEVAGEGAPGELVLIDLIRDGHALQLAVERGALGVTERVDIFRGLEDLSRAPPISD